MLDNYRDKLMTLSGVLASIDKGYLGLLSGTRQNIESQIVSILTFLNQRIKRLNSGWPNTDIRNAKADELRTGRKSQKTPEPKQKFDPNTLKAVIQKDPRG